MNATLKIKGIKPSSGWGFEFTSEHHAKFGQYPSISIQEAAHQLTAKHLSELMGKLELLGYDPATFTFQIKIKSDESGKEEQP